MAEKDKEQIKPLAFPSPETIVPAGNDEEAAGTVQYLRRRRCFLLCCGCCGAVVVVFGIVVLILSLTLLKVKDATLTMNSLTLDGVSLMLGDLSHPVSVNATFVADISIKNPNVASFRFANSTTNFFYGGETIGVAYAPSGKVAARRTVRMDVKVEVLTDRVAERMNISNDIITSGAEMNLTSFTDISGKVSVLGIFKRDLELMMNCSLTLDVSITKQELTRTNCMATVK